MSRILRSGIVVENDVQDQDTRYCILAFFKKRVVQHKRETTGSGTQWRGRKKNMLRTDASGCGDEYKLRSRWQGDEARSIF